VRRKLIREIAVLPGAAAVIPAAARSCD